MSEWDFLWGLEGEELRDAMSSGATREDWDEIERQERKKRWEELKSLRDTGQITKVEFHKRKSEIFI